MSQSYTNIERCRICSNRRLSSVLSLGEQALTGIFPKTKEQKVVSGPLELVKCDESQQTDTCGLVQLMQSYDKHQMYGEDYGYRSGLNKSMVEHLRAKVRKIMNGMTLDAGDLIVDIGSNDSTLLQFYPEQGLLLVGIDPTGNAFKEYYPSHIQLIPDFFSAKILKEAFGNKKAKVVTSIAMFYDLDSPLDFMRQIFDILTDDGVWVFEQSYLPTMLKINAYDTICHEHLEYYRLKQIKWMAERVGFKIIDLELNSVNGGSFSVTVAKSNSPYRENQALVRQWLGEEEKEGLGTMGPYQDFRRRVMNHKIELLDFLQRLKSDHKKVFGYGASTKGNVILQYCSLTEKDIPCIGEINAKKFGCLTPQTHIPIVSEEEVKALRPDYLMVLPWHFKDYFLEREKDYLKSGGKLFFPLPFIHVAQRDLEKAMMEV